MVSHIGRSLVFCLVALFVLFPTFDGVKSPVAHLQDHGRTGLGHLDPGEFRLIPAGTPGPVPAKEAGSETVAFRPSGAPVQSKEKRRSPRVEVFQTGTNALEPTLGIDQEGRVFYIGMDGAQWPAFPTETTRTSDDGKTWESVTPSAPHDHPTTQDPYLYVDETTGRVFTTDFMLPCAAVSRSDDGGESWTTSITACDLLDHQTVFAGKPVTSAPSGYPNVVYYCAADYAIGLGVSCLKSIDGGQVFLRTGEPAYPESDPVACGWGSGHGVAGPDGAIYLPAGICSQPTLAISRDEGATWERVQVADMRMGSDGRVDHDAAVAIDSKSNLYYAWTGADLNPYLSVSKDGGGTWSKPVDISPPGVKIATLIALDVASPGNLAVSFVGSRTRSAFGLGKYDGFMMITSQGLAHDPLFYTSRINPADDPIDGGCSTGSCSTNREFIDVAIAPDGSAWAAFSDGCYDDVCGHYDKPFVGIAVGRGLAARLVGGPRLN